MEISRLRKLSDNVESTMDSMAKIKVAGYDLEEARIEQLEVTDENLNESVSMQPTAISYFTSCLSAAKRNLDFIIFEYELWRKERQSDIKKAATAKITAAEMEVRTDVENKAELMNWMMKIQDAQQLFDNAESIYEGWKQKGFALNQHAKLKNQDYISTSGGSIVEKGAYPDDFALRAKRVRELQAKKCVEE